MRCIPPRRSAAPQGPVLGRALATALVALLLTGSGPAPGTAPRAVEAAPASPAPLAATALDRLLADRRLTGAAVSALVTDATTGEVLYQHSPDAQLLPASTLKTVTAAAALDLLGPDHRFTTTVLAAGRRTGTVLTGDLVLRGGGDPSLLPADLDALAARVAAAGIGEVSGDVLADASRYDDVPLGAGWAWDDQGAYYSPEISALTLTTDADDDVGSVRLTLTPDPAPGHPAAVRVTPAEAPVRLSGHVDTGAPGGETTAEADRRPGGNEIVLSGTLPADAGPTEEWVAVTDPARLAGTVFRAALARHGVTVRGEVREQPAPGGAAVLAEHDSVPLAALLPPFLKLSNNGIAEHLVKEVGRVRSGSGSWTAGLAQLADFSRRAGLTAASTRQADGSGLSRKDLTTARNLTALLHFARQQPWFAAWYDALPVAGDPRRMVGGTLSGRMRGTPAEGRVHAKTGSMTGVEALAGYLDRADGRTLAFAVLLDDFTGESPRPVLDAFAAQLAGTDASAAAAGPGPTPRRLPPGIAHDWESGCAAAGRC
ncbi:D-alanyl-D-alanine carboxypeptidase/D-alanyl-D-alanine endopeptidase [Kitasatospora sp. NBC_01302]|uniref:D-alanyl-D-alanine carboxypeptidase/D-alanyl-D-alanine endopeptidase n=1 Tax=Kitasatospora sp. NBC_01302 TaxID=2903575 RepID=UPI002E11E2C8|nr:D-alanyl-D-alanine carboxypeptidase/D-alanyl-D-alanine-endopeptidase [Kitasatospora sp. NBC_01302]